MSEMSSTHLTLRADVADWASVPFFPVDALGPPDDSLLDRLYLTLASVEETDEQTTIHLGVGWEGNEEAVFPLLGIQGLSLVLGGGSSAAVSLSLIFAEDGISFSVTSRIGLRFDTSLIRPVALENGEYVAIEDGVYEVAFEDATVTLAANGDLTFENLDTLDFAPFAIGETGVVVAPGEMTLCFSADVAEALVADHPDAGLDASFRGAFIVDGSVHFPEMFPVESVVIRNAFIGNLGFTGTVQATISDSDTGMVSRGMCAGFPFALKGVSLSFVQNALTGCAIDGDLTIPFFDKTVGVTLGFGLDGALALGLSDPSGLVNLDIEAVGTLKVTGLGLVIDGIDVGLVLSGSILLSVAGLQWPEIGVQELSIHPDGTVSVSGGWLKLQAPLAVDLFGFRLEISQIGFGKENDGRSWIGFSGGLHLIDLLPTGASVEGMRILWQPGTNLTPQITLQGVGIELTVPGALEFTGDVTMINDGDDHYFAGSAELALTPLGITLDAVVKIGHNADLDFNYVYIFLSLQLPIGIPLWASGTALYGISGLLGVNVEPDTTGGDWYGWYAGPPQFNITDDSKWRGALDSMAFGAGVVIGTVFDTGFTISTKSLVALLLPGPVILFNGMANFLQLPPGLLDNSEGSLSMLAVLDARAGNLLFTIEADWELPQVVDVQASAEAYFDFARPENWHVYLGQDTPDERRIRANVLALFNADAYLMIDHEGIAAGFGVDFGDEWRFGPVQVALKSWIASGAAITWQPAQLEGQLGLGGEFSIGVAGFSAGIAAEATLSGKAPKPYWIRGDLTVRLNLPAPIKDLEENILLEWKQDLPPGLQDPFSSISLEHLKVSETWTPRLSGTDNDPTSAGYDAGPVVPLDVHPLIVFDRAVLDNSGLNNVNAQYGGSTRIGDYTFDYTLDPGSIRLEMWPKAGAGGWTAFASADLDGAWAVEVDGEGKVSASKLQVMAKTPFAFTRRTSRTYADWFLAAYPDWPCGEAVPATERCVDWHGVELQEASGTAFVHDDLTFLSEYHMQLSGGHFMPACPDPAGIALHFAYTLWILFPEPVRRVELCLKGTFDAVRGWAAGEMVQETTSPAEGMVVLEAGGITWVEVVSRFDDAWLGSVCYTTEAESAAADQEIRNLERIEANVLRWSSADVLLPPNTYFRLAVTARTTRKRDGVADDEDDYTHYAYFHTDGPPALLPAWAGPSAPPETSDTALPVDSYPTGGKLTDLSVYVAQSIPAHGQIAVYRAYGLGVEFSENYVQQMYGADMVIRLRDANDQPILDADGKEIEFLNAWEELPTTALSITEIPYVTRIQDCMPLSVESIAPDQTLITTYGVLFQEEFDGTLDNWTDPNAPDGDPDAAWTIGGGMVSVSSAILSPLGALLVAGDPGWADYAVEAELTETGGEVGLVFRYTGGDTNAYYRLRLNAAGRTLERVSGAVVDTLWRDEVSYTPATDLTLAVQCFGARIRGQLGTELLFDLTDAESLPVGQIGLYANTTAAFERVLVREWPGAALAPETLYRAELAGTYVLFQADGWPVDPLAAGWLELADADNPNRRLIAIGQSEWTDCRLEATLTPVNGAPLGLLVRVQLEGDTFRAYRLYWNTADDSIRFALVSGALDLGNGTYTIDSRGSLWDCTGAACGIDFGLTEHDVAIVCEGTQFGITIDGVQIASVTDGTLASGQIGLYYGGQAAPTGFAELLVRSEPRGALYGWQFASSAYAGVVEHMDTFSGVVYDDVPSRPDGGTVSAQIVSAAAAVVAANAAVLDARNSLAVADALTMTPRLAEAHAALAARAQTMSDQFEAIFGQFFGESYRPLPPVVELTALRSADGPYALLLECPEPVDWDRIEVQVKRKAAGGQYHDVTASGLVTWNADGTRALFMNAGGAALQSGDFALHFVYQLDVGAEAPVLRRSGSTLPEIAALHFSL